jgi:hypothetical protein
MEIDTAENLSRKLRSLANGADGMTAHDWYLWLQGQERISLDEYRGRPSRLVSDFKGENQYIRDYDGREILELLQNGNDAARKAGTRARMRFELLPSGLIAANTGAPFSSPGVASLCLPHTSPKPAEGPLMIGNKGLGFRAVLNWTRFPLILSGELAIVFSARLAQEKQTKLELLSEELRACIEQEKQLSGDRVVPLLAFPGFSSDGDLTDFLDDAQNAIYSRCRELREAGYDTVIGMPFNQESIHAAARKQIRLVRPEILLFASSLADLEIVVEGEPSECWRRDEPGGVASRVYVGSSDADYREWKLYSKRGAVPREYLPPEQPSSTEYELVLAIPTNHNAVPGYLYSYFPTEVRFPYPLVCHATLDLISNRQQPQNTPANQFILGQLAEFMADTAEILAREISSESGLKLIAGDSSSSDGLEKFDFRSQLLNAAKTRAIVPTLNNGIVISDKARSVAFSDTSWLPKTVFGSVINLKDQSLRPVLEKLDVPPLCASDWLIAEGSLRFETLEERAKFIAGVIRFQVSEAFTLGGLLLDGNEKPVPKGYRVFLPPTAQRGLSLPEWFEIRFLHQGLRQALMDKLQPKDQEGLASLLSPLGVTRYSLDNVLSALVAQANRRTEAEPDQKDSIRRELLKALCDIFPLSESREERARFPKDARVLVLTKSGTYEDARKLYLSAEYGSRGRILEDLYGSFAPEKLIAPPATLGVNGETFPLAEFFLWIGVAEFPREIVFEPTHYPDYAFQEHVKASMSEPVVMQDLTFKHIEDLPWLTFAEVVSVEGLEKFLSQAPAAAVLSWLATDNRALNWKSPSVSHGKVGCSPSGRHYARYSAEPIPSYVRWKLQTTKWLPTRNKRLAAPQGCLAEPVQGIEDLLPQPARPTSEQAQRYDVPISYFRDAFDRAGVLPGFSQIDPEQLYELLLSLPKCDKNGSVAKSVYNAVLKHFESADVRDSAARERFIRTGEIFARSPTGDNYCSIEKVRHVDSEDIPAALRRRINVAALPKRSGSQKVLALFGVQTVERSEIIRRITHYQPVCDASIVDDEIQHLKPLFFYLRRSQARRAKESEEFVQLKVLVCSSIEGEVEFQGQKEPLELESWGWIPDDQSHTAYVFSDPSESDLLKSALLADVVGQIFAAVFRIERGDDFARLFACQRKDRLKILKRLVGEDDVPAMEELERLYSDTAEQGDDSEVNFPDGALDQPSPRKKDVTQQDVPEEQGTGTSPPQDGDKPPQIDSIPHTPSGPPVRVECRVSRQGPTGPRKRAGSRRVTDGLFCEYKAIEFEEHDAPPRFPVRVGNITGWDAPGVDVLSFASAEDRANFLAGDHSEARITRFIEVKGRSSEGAKIDLRDNALEAARKYKDKYFLYRVFDRNDDSYALAILKNPLADETGVKAVYEVNLDAATRTEEFSIVGGWSESSYLEHLAEKQSETIP